MSRLKDGAEARPGRVLVTDGEFKHTLGIVRALAARGHEVHLMARSGRAPAAHSRAVAAWHPGPPSGAAEFDDRLLEVLATLQPLSLVPIGSGAMASAHRLRARFDSGVRVALPPPAGFETANDKLRTGEVARSVGLQTPREWLVADALTADATAREIGFPLVLKSPNEEGRKALRYVARPEDLAVAFGEVRTLSSSGSVLAQERVPGEGYGFSALYWQGRRVRHFMHRRVREWPPSGGTSACAESLPDAPELER